MNNVEHKLGQLDYGNRAAITDLVDKMLLLQGKADSNFQKAKIVTRLRMPHDCNAPSVIINKLKNITNIDHLTNYKKSKIEEYNGFIEELTKQHNENLDAINSNSELKSKIIELFTYIGIQPEYSELKISGLKVKTIKYKSGYLSDIDRVCVTDDGYDHNVHIIKGYITQVECEYDKIYNELQHKTAMEMNKSLFYKFNHYALNFNIEVKDVVDFINVKQSLLGEIDSALGNLYKEKVSEKIEDGYDVTVVIDHEIDAVDNILFNNTALIDSEVKSLLKMKYYVYQYTKQQIIGA